MAMTKKSRLKSSDVLIYSFENSDFDKYGNVAYESLSHVNLISYPTCKTQMTPFLPISFWLTSLLINFCFVGDEGVQGSLFLSYVQ